MFRRNDTIRPLTAKASRGGMISSADADRLFRAVTERHYRREVVGRSVARSHDDSGELVDFLYAGAQDPNEPSHIFNRLRWGGVFIYIGAGKARAKKLAEQFDNRHGFVLERGPAQAVAGRFGLRLNWLSRNGFFFAARKTHLIMPGQTTDRFTYDVRLERHAEAKHGYVVTKQVPTYDELMHRLRVKFPNAAEEELDSRARQFIGAIFPTFLTREAAFLEALQSELPAEYRSRVPKLIDVQRNGDGAVTRIRMTWLRTGGRVLSQLEFARQAAELLSVLHDTAGIIHLDLRLDNFVVTPAGVGFVDFGSAVRADENLKQTPGLTSLFREMMRTSQIQRMLGRMVQSGELTNRAMRAGQGRVDKAVDSFYLAVQIRNPTKNPEFKHLIRHQPDSGEAKALEALTAAILRPKHPEKNEFKTAADILRGIRRIEQRQGASRAA